MRRTGLLPMLAAVSGVTCSAPFSVQTTLVVINDSYQFVPDTVIMSRGSTIEWKNESSQYHLVQSDSLKSGAMEEFALAPVGGEDRTFTDSQAELQMPEPGVYPYHCTVHLQMHGVVIVR